MRVLLGIPKKVKVLVLSCVVLGLAIVWAPQAYGAWGPGGSGVGGSGVGFYTTNGFGWALYSKSGGGPSDGFRDGTRWSDVQNRCSSYTGGGVWVHVVLNSGGSQKAFSYEGATWNRDRPTSGADPYVYDANGNYSNQGAAYQQSVINIVASVHAKFNVAEPDADWHWGRDVGWFCDGQQRREWSINGQSYIQNGRVANKGAAVSGTVTAGPGDRLNWYHDLRNNGPDAMDRTVYWNVDKTGFSNGWNNNKDPRGNTSGGAGALFVYEYAQFPDEPWRGASPYTLYDVTQDDVGNTLCQRIAWNPGSWNDGNWYASGYACATVPYNYSLTPTIRTVSDGDTVEAGKPDIPIGGNITNNGPTKSQSNVQWQITEARYAPGAPISNRTGGTSTADPCMYFSGSVCRSLKDGVEASGYGYPATAAYDTTTNSGDEPVGTRLCYALSVRPYEQNTANWRHSQLYCLVVNKQPKVQVLGGDLLVGRGSVANPGRASHVTTSVSRTNAFGYFGSWSEYGITSTGIVTGMASGSAYAGGSGTADLCGHLSILTFTNASSGGICSEGAIGNYTTSTIAPNVASRFPVTHTTPVLDNVADIGGGLLGIYTVTDPTLAVVSGTAVSAGQWVVINAPDTTVTIGSDIRYTSDTLQSINQIPQVLIIAKDILIADTVTHIDSWLVATGSGVDGRINTCAAGAVNESSLPTSTVCVEKLVVNGPVIANHLLLRRTAGAGQGRAAGEPAEVFNLRADAYLWALQYSRRAGRVPTVMTKEVPPRF